MLTERQKEVVAWIERWTLDHGGTSPSYRDIAKAFGLSTGNVSALLQSLRERGGIEQATLSTGKRMARGIRVLPQRVAYQVWDDEEKRLRPLGEKLQRKTS